MGCGNDIRIIFVVAFGAILTVIPLNIQFSFISRGSLTMMSLKFLSWE